MLNLYHNMMKNMTLLSGVWVGKRRRSNMIKNETFRHLQRRTSYLISAKKIVEDFKKMQYLLMKPKCKAILTILTIIFWFIPWLIYTIINILLLLVFCSYWEHLRIGKQNGVITGLHISFFFEKLFFLMVFI
jgi:hypothetical protein